MEFWENTLDFCSTGDNCGEVLENISVQGVVLLVIFSNCKKAEHQLKEKVTAGAATQTLWQDCQPGLKVPSN